MAEPAKFPARTPEKLLILLRRNFPTLRWKKQVFIDEGWDHDVVILDNSLVFRFPNDQYYLDLLQSEVRLLGGLRPLTKVKTPSYTYVARDFTVAGYPLIPGKFLSKTYFDGLKDEDRATIARQLADLLSVLHTLMARGYDVSYVPGWNFGEEQAATKRLADQHLQTILKADEYALVERIMAEVDALVGRPKPTVFIHGDIYSNHLLWDARKQRLGVIDFSDMSQGDAALDFAELYEYGEAFVQAVYEAYTAPKDETFLERAWTYQKWTVVYMMTDHFVYHKTSFAEARKTFDRIKPSL